MINNKEIIDKYFSSTIEGFDAMNVKKKEKKARARRRRLLDQSKQKNKIPYLERLLTTKYDKQRTYKRFKFLFKIKKIVKFWSEFLPAPMAFIINTYMVFFVKSFYSFDATVVLYSFFIFVRYFVRSNVHDWSNSQAEALSDNLKIFKFSDLGEIPLTNFKMSSNKASDNVVGTIGNIGGEFSDNMMK